MTIKTLIKKHWQLLLGLILVLPAVWPLFHSGFFHMHDYTHVARLVELDLGLLAGQFPPRWAADFGWGYGMPLFHFYNPLPYYLAELLYLIKVPAVICIKIIFGLNFFAGFYFMYLWAKQYWDSWGSMIAATAFTYLPYRAVQFYVRGSLAELTATTFIPLFFYAAKKKNWLLIALSLTAIFLSHNVIGLFCLLFVPLYFLFNWRSYKIWLLSGLLAFTLSAFFVIPAFFEKNFTSLNNLTDGFFNYRFHFIYLRQLFSRYYAYGGSVLGPKDDISFQLGLPHIILILPAVWLWFKSRSWRKSLTYIFISLCLSVFLMTFHSQFIWDKIALLQLAQFPWRLLAFAGSFIAFLSGSVTKVVKSPVKKRLAAYFILILLIGLNFQFFKPQSYSPADQFYYTDRQKIKDEMSDVLYDYLPLTAKKPDQPSTELFNLNPSAIIVDSPDTLTYTLNQYYFPGWQVKIDNQTVELQPDPIGRISFVLPAGHHQLAVILKKTRLQTIADSLSLVAWIGVLAYIIHQRKFTWKA